MTCPDLKIMDDNSLHILITFNRGRSINQSINRTFCSIPACAILSKLIEKEPDKDGSTCWLLRGHRFPIKAPSAVPWTAPVPSQTLKCLGPPPTYLRSWQPSSSSSPSTWLSRTNVAKRRELDPSPTPWWTMDSILTESFLASASTTASTQSLGHRAQSFAFRKVFQAFNVTHDLQDYVFP